MTSCPMTTRRSQIGAAAAAVDSLLGQRRCAGGIDGAQEAARFAKRERVERKEVARSSDAKLD